MQIIFATRPGSQIDLISFLADSVHEAVLRAGHPLDLLPAALPHTGPPHQAGGLPGCLALHGHILQVITDFYVDSLTLPP